MLELFNFIFNIFMVPVILYIIIDSIAYDSFIKPFYELYRGMFEVDGQSCLMNEEGYWPNDS